jgi:hypothetical protein
MYPKSAIQMSHVVKLAQEISKVLTRYKKVHDQIFSLRKAVFMPNVYRGVDYLAHEQELRTLRNEIGKIQFAIAQLRSTDLTRRSGEEVRGALLRYTEALWDAVNKLQVICRNLRLEDEGVQEFTGYSTSYFRHDRVNYDDAVQHYRRWGVRLNGMFSNL